MSALVATPVLVPLATVVLTTLASRRPALQQALSFAGVLAFLACAMALVALAAADKLQVVVGVLGQVFGEYRVLLVDAPEDSWTPV